MAKHNTNSKEGFTIIEVVLVLAIAGLIFLMVFVALPALQRSQRDTQRRNDMSRVDTSLVQYQTNNSSAANNLPEGPSFWKGAGDYGDGCGTNAACNFIQRYMNSGSDSKVNTFEDPDGVYYSLYITKNFAKDGGTSDISVNGGDQGYNIGSGQTGGSYTVKSEFDQHIIYIIPGGQCAGEDVVQSTKRHFAILYRLEGAGVYCIDDQ